jgi:hypothetical protein
MSDETPGTQRPERVRAKRFPNATAAGMAFGKTKSKEVL